MGRLAASRMFPAALVLSAACSADSGGSETDRRTPLAVPTGAADAVRAEMRTMLGSLHSLLTAMPQGDTAAMRQAATAAGMAAAADTALEDLLPEEFLVLGTATHRQFDSLAAAIVRGVPTDSVAARLGLLTTNCVSCHATYRLAPAARR